MLQPISSVVPHFVQNWGYISILFHFCICCKTSKCVLLFFSHVSTLLLLFFLRLLLERSSFHYCMTELDWPLCYSSNADYFLRQHKTGLFWEWRCSVFTAMWELKCPRNPKSKVLYFLTHEDGADRLSRNVGKHLPLHAAQQPTRA